MKLLYQERAYAFRSPGLFLFLKLLQDAYPGWVDKAAIENRMPGVDPRQLARFVDLLEAADLPLVVYETKTRGRFWLAVAPELVAFSGDQLAKPEASPVAALPARNATPLAVYQDEAWVLWMVALLHSALAVHAGHLGGDDGALDHLDTAEAAAATLPLWTLSVVHLRRAFTLTRASRYREAARSLRRVDTAVRHGNAHPACPGAAQLVRAKIRYDQARYDQALHILDSPPPAVGQHCPHWLNMNALLSGRKFLVAGAPDAPALLAQTLAALAEAFGYVFLWQGDSSLLDALCYNFGNNLLRGIKRGLIPKASADAVMQWLAANMLVCRKLGVGEDSVLANLLLIDVALEHGNSLGNWPALRRYGADFCGDLATLLDKTLAQARLTGNGLEIAQCLRRQVQLSTSAEDAMPAYLEAVALFGEQGKKDVAAELAERWRSQFGKSPPTPTAGR
ncbi:MAG: hypothetical protein H6R17_339 [Proteobacteria bacterium]|nr:hypothetical protein [Pseudomonadota bacterium]